MKRCMCHCQVICSDFRINILLCALVVGIVYWWQRLIGLPELRREFLNGLIVVDQLYVD